MKIPLMSVTVKFSVVREHPFLTLLIAAGFLIRIVYDALAVQSGEFTNWISAGVNTATNDSLAFRHSGIYTAGAYMFSLAYRLWSFLPVEHPSFGSVYVRLAGDQGPLVFQQSLPNYIFVLSMKGPIMVFDFLILMLIIRAVSSKTASTKAALLAGTAWVWNPLVTLLENYNGIDVAPAFFLLLAAYLFERNKPSLVSLSLAIGTLLRIVPLLVVPAYALKHLRTRKWPELLKLLLPGTVLVVVILTAYITAYGFEAFDTLIRGRPGLLVYEALAFMGPAIQPRLGFAWNGFLAFNLLLYFLLVGLTSSRSHSAGFGEEISSVLLAFFATSWFHFAFFLWLLPFLTIENLGLNRRVALYLVLTAGGLLWTVFQASTTVFSFGTSILFVPVTPDQYPFSRSLATLQFSKGLEFIRAFLSGALLAQLALVVSRNLKETL